MQAEQSLRRLNNTLERYMALITPLGVLAGLLFHGLLQPFKPLVTWFFAFISLVNSMGVSVRDFGKVVRHPRPILLFALTSYIIIPISVSLGAKALFAPDTVSGFVLLTAIPTAVSACVWSGIYKGNAALSLTILVIGTVLAPLSTPLTVSLLTSSDIALDTTGMMVSLLLMVVLPSVLGIALNTVTNGKCNDHVAPCLKPFTKIVLVFVVGINTSQVAEELLSSLSLSILPQILYALVITACGFLLSALAARLGGLEGGDAVSMVLASSMRNISAAMVIAISFFPPASVLPVIFGIVLQQSVCAASCHLLFAKRER